MKYSDWNAEECATFSSIVKPVSVDLNSWGGSDRVESLFLCKTLVFLLCKNSFIVLEIGRG